MSLQGSQKLAIVLCKFNDSAKTDPNPKSFYEDLFIKRATGGLNDYWLAASLGAMNLDGSEVFGWKTLDTTLSNFLTNHAGRGDKVKAALAAFELDAANYVGVVAIFDSDMTDAGTEPPKYILAHHGALDDTVNVTFLAHEIGHVLNFDHSWDQSDRQKETWSGLGEYWDKYDLMSAMNCFGDDKHRFSPRGPLLNVAHVDRVGWLPSFRMFQFGGAGSSGGATIDLVALEHPEVNGYLAAKFGDVYVEFRIPIGWDAAIPRACILIHQRSDPNTILLPLDSANHNNEFLPGDVWGATPQELVFVGGDRIEILAFNLAAKTARIRLRRVVRRLRNAGPGIILGGVKVGGNGIVILPGGRIIPIPPNSPLLHLAEATALLMGVAGVNSVPNIDPKSIRLSDG